MIAITFDGIGMTTIQRKLFCCEAKLRQIFLGLAGSS
jgi:hypothetical protein